MVNLKKKRDLFERMEEIGGKRGGKREKTWREVNLQKEREPRGDEAGIDPSLGFPARCHFMRKMEWEERTGEQEVTRLAGLSYWWRGTALGRK